MAASIWYSTKFHLFSPFSWRRKIINWKTNLKFTALFFIVLQSRIVVSFGLHLSILNLCLHDAQEVCSRTKVDGTVLKIKSFFFTQAKSLRWSRILCSLIPGDSPYNGLYEDKPPKKGCTLFRLQLNKRVANFTSWGIWVSSYRNL